MGFQRHTRVFFGLDDKEGEDDEVVENNEEAGIDEEAGSDEDFRTPRGSTNIGSTARNGMNRIPDRGMKKKES